MNDWLIRPETPETPRYPDHRLRRHGRRRRAEGHVIEMQLPDWAPPEAGQVHPLPAYDPADATSRGTISYPPVYG